MFTKKGQLVSFLGIILLLYMVLGKAFVANFLTGVPIRKSAVRALVERHLKGANEVSNVSFPVHKSEVQHETETNQKTSLVENKLSGLRIIPKPNLIQMINASQAIPTLTAPYRLENPYLCSSVPELSVLVIVHTACKNFQRRLSIRQTWANSSNYNHQIRILFLIGITSESDSDTKLNIESEFKQFNDLLVGDFNDTYHNLTLKGVMGYKWITERCRNAKMILKADDDVTVNMFRFFEDVYEKYVIKPRHIICNKIMSGTMSIIRDIKSKWYVGNRYFKGYSSYPTDYCSGFFVAMTADLIPLLYESSKITSFFWVDDVYLYGLVPGNVPGVQYIGLSGGWDMLDGQKALRCYKNITLPCPYMAIGAGAKGEPEDIWHEILKRQVLKAV